MSLIDFKEIPQANRGGGEQDTFELFTRELLDLMGFTIVEDPDRGPDGGRDLIVLETRTGLMGETQIKWLVSCKHWAHSGKAVLENEEQDVTGRLEQFDCKGFIGVYSTIASSGLANKLNSYKEKYEIKIWDHEKIEGLLLKSPEMEKLVKRFFPNSYEKISPNKSPANLYSKYVPIKCAACGRDLLYKDVINSYGGIVVLAYELEEEVNNAAAVLKKRITNVYCVCKGDCDRQMKSGATSWEDISDLAIPYKFLSWVVAAMNLLRSGEITFTDQAYEDFKQIILSIAQVVMRGQSTEEMERIKELQEFSDAL